MPMRAILAVSLSTLTLTACGGSDEEPPVEQIVVREPGAPVATGSGSTPDLIAAGEAAFAVCSGCHVADAGAASTAGPNLHGVVGRQAGAVDDFAYTEALSGSGITWDEAELDRFLANPAQRIPGTAMVAGGISDDERRAAVIAYLGSLND